MYIFKYSTKDGKEIGYHLDSFCSVGSKERAKRYGCPTWESAQNQKQIISSNLKSVLNTTENDKGIFTKVCLDIHYRYFPGLTFDDVVITPEEVPDVEVTRTVHTIVSDGNVTSVNIPLETALVNKIKEDI